MDEATLPLTSNSSSSLTLISRLDQLEFIMKYLERKQRVGSNGCDEKQCVPSDMTVKETYLKGSLLDRVASLENRLFQLCVEMDSRSSSYPLSTRASTQASGESSCSHMCSSKTEISFPTFNYNLPTHRQPRDTPMPHNHTNINALHHQLLHFQEKSVRRQQHEMKNESAPKQQQVKNRGKTNEKKSKQDNAKKRAPPATYWPHLKLLGC